LSKTLRLLIVAALGATVLIASSASAQSFIELQVPATPKAAPMLTGYLLKNFENSPFGLTSAFAITDNWAEAHAGLAWQPVPYLYFGSGLGLETGGGVTLGRLALNPGFFTETASVTLLVEANKQALKGDPYAVFYDFTAKKDVSAALTFGVKSRYGLGTGPLAEVRLNKTFAIWAAWTPYRWEITSWTPANGVIGLRANM